jgi:hypothetical protein
MLDELAKAAMHAILSSVPYGDQYVASDIAQEAYNMAEEMIRERSDRLQNKLMESAMNKRV